MIAQLQPALSESLFVKNPQISELGEKIISESIHLIDEIGFEAFTFKKLSTRINSTEASIYRYFENKHRLLLYLITWYWSYIEYRINFETHNLPDPVEKLKAALRIITALQEDDHNFKGVSEKLLQRIVIAESDKTYLTKNVDDDNKEGFFRGYKSLCNTIANYVLEINPAYEFPNSLISTCLEAAHQQIFFAEHLPALSNIKKEKDMHETNYDFLFSLITKAIK
ncbi:MAG: TetR/AcrR family transcriptional regulator [Cyclobacteriaceae bacterium]